MTAGIAERGQISCYIFYTLFAATFIYPFGVHWAWTGDGWLKKGGNYLIDGEWEQIGYEDFAGSGVVHSSGGIAALVAVIFVGPRIGRFLPDGTVNEISGHSMPVILNFN